MFLMMGVDGCAEFKGEGGGKYVMIKKPEEKYVHE